MKSLGNRVGKREFFILANSNRNKNKFISLVLYLFALFLIVSSILQSRTKIRKVWLLLGDKSKNEIRSVSG
jgi:hypothetical protein